MPEVSNGPSLVQAMSPLIERFKVRYRVPAVGAALIAADGPFHSHVLGTRRRDKDDPVQVTDGWHIGSCAKALTAALYSRLVARCEAQWGVSVAELFPDLEEMIHLGWREKTVDEVFHCRSGLRANLYRHEMYGAWASTEALPAQRTKSVLAALAEPPGPRGRFLYSNLGYIVIGAAIERLTGKSYESSLDELLLRPLGITAAGFGPPAEIWGHSARFHLGSFGFGLGRGANPREQTSDNPPVMNSAGRLHLSLSDWVALQRLFMSEAQGVLHPESLKHLLQVPPGGGVPMAMGWASARGFGEAAFGMQGSNTYWSACALMDAPRRRMTLVICNDGRSRVLSAGPYRAAELLRLKW